MAGSDENCGVFPDLRHQFLRGLIQHENWQRTRHYLKSAAECTSRAIVSIELSAQPIKSPRQAQRLESIGGETVKRLKKFMEENRFPRTPPVCGRFVSSAGALLMALKTEADQNKDSRGKDDVHFVSEQRLKARANKLCEEEFNDNGFCQAWWRIEVLVKRGFVKRKFYKKTPVYYLLPEGREVVQRLVDNHRGSGNSIPVYRKTSGLSPVMSDRSGGNSIPVHRKTSGLSPVTSDRSGGTSRYTVPVWKESAEFRPPERSSETFIDITDHTKDRMKSGGNLIDNQDATSQSSSRTDHNCKQSGSSLLPWQCDQTGSDYRHGNDTGNDGLLLLVDTSEWGGEPGNLIQLGEMLDNVGMTYQTKKLTTGDYSWKWRYHGEERVLPCLVERKRADDLARTLKEGIFWSQVQEMADWKEKFTTSDLPCELFYVVEGKPEQYVVNCKDGCKGVGMCKNPSLIQVKNAIKDLSSHPDIQVLHSDSVEETVAILESITVDLDQKVKAGKFDLMLELEWERCRGNQNPCVVTVDDSDEEDPQSVIKSSRVSSTAKTESILSGKSFQDETLKKPPGSVVCGLHSRAGQFDKILRASPPQNNEYGFNSDMHYEKQDFDVIADKCVDDNDGDMNDPDWLPDLTCSAEQRHKNWDPIPNLTGSPAQCCKNWESIPNLFSSTEQCHKKWESIPSYSDDLSGKDKCPNLPRLYQKNQKRKIVGVQNETDLRSRNTQLSKRERKTKFEERDRLFGLHNDSYGDVDVEGDFTTSENISPRSLDRNRRSINSKEKWMVADNSSDVTGMENWSDVTKMENWSGVTKMENWSDVTKMEDWSGVTKMEDWSGRNKQEPLVMYHNSLGFQPQTPDKEKKKNPLCIHKVSSCVGTVQYQDRNHKSTTSKSWISGTDEENVQCRVSSGHHDDKSIQIRDMFPSLSREAVYDVMSRHSGDIASCVEELLQTQEID